jgi:hypothetical protein
VDRTGNVCANAHNILVGGLEAKRPLERPKGRRKNKAKRDLEEFLERLYSG